MSLSIELAEDENGQLVDFQELTQAEIEELRKEWEERHGNDNRK